MNSVILVGRLTRDPEVRYTSDTQRAIANFSIAIDRGKGRDGKDLGTDFPNIVCYGKTAELVEKYVGKGMQVGIQGRLQTRSYENKEGKKVYVTEVVADRVEFLDSKRKPNQVEASVLEDVKQTESDMWKDFIPDDIPF